MKAIVFLSAWSFIFLAGAFDGGFAWYYSDTFEAWELNPLARWLFQQCGIASVLAGKALALAFAALMASYCRRRRHSLEMPLTLVIAAFYLLLCFHYVAEYASPEAAASKPVDYSGARKAPQAS